MYKRQELTLTAEGKALVENNHIMVETDTEYAEKTRERSIKRNAEVQRLSTKINDLEDQVASQQEIKISIFKLKARRRAVEQLVQTTQNLKAAKNELEVTLQTFTIEQEKLHDNYEKRKKELNEDSDRLHKELEKFETDPSTGERQETCNALAKVINALLKRMPAPPNGN